MFVCLFVWFFLQNEHARYAVNSINSLHCNIKIPNFQRIHLLIFFNLDQFHFMMMMMMATSKIT